MQENRLKSKILKVLALLIVVGLVGLSVAPMKTTRERVEQPLDASLFLKKS